jgi:Family of unknown function (DUF6167)
MSGGLWFVAGAGVGIYGMIRARRAAETFTVDGMRDRVGAAVVGARMFRDEVAQGRAEAESGLRERLGRVPHGRPELESSGFETGASAPSSTTAGTGEER